MIYISKKMPQRKGIFSIAIVVHAVLMEQKKATSSSLDN